MDKPVSTIWLPGRGLGKARPRWYEGRMLTSEKYRHWKQSAINTVVSYHLEPAPKPCYVACYFVNFFTSDADNIQGSVLDVLVQAGYLENDSSSYVCAVSGMFCKTRKKRNEDKPVGILIQVYSAEIKTIVLEDLIDGNGMACA